MLSLPYSFWGLAASDLVSVALSFALAYSLRGIFPGSLDLENYLNLCPALLLFPALFAALNLYPGTLIHPAEELKLLSRATTVGFALIAVSFFLFKNADAFSRAFFLTAWIFALLLAPLFRHIVRRYCDRFIWWKTPVIFFGGRDDIETFGLRLSKVTTLGFAPVASIIVPPDAHGAAVHTSATRSTKTSGKPENASPQAGSGSETQAPAPSPASQGLWQEELYSLPMHDPAAVEKLFGDLAQKYPHAIVNVFTASIPQETQESLLRTAGGHFYRLIIVPPMDWLYCIPDKVANLGGAFALTLRRNLCDTRRLLLKRVFDLIACTTLSLLALPVFLGLALLLKLDSPGPVIFRQTRIGRGGKPFRVFKFRTMQADAEAILKSYLDSQPEEAREWAATQKLKHDPRITRMGRFLRKTSLDELPQVLNVFLGEMSLVGPRPIVQDEVVKYGDVFTLYEQVLPGITGLWQISGRNDISYEERIALDRYYITNWSIWFDWYILARTVPVVLGRQGAY